MLAYVFVVLAFLFRFVPHPWGFTPVAGSLLFFGANRSRRQLWFPMALLCASDVVLTKFVYGAPFSWDHFVTWAWYAGVLFLGTRLREHSKPLWIAGSALTSSVAFFLASNFAVWAGSNMYPKNFSGLLASYVMGLPFFQRGAAGDLIFTSLMFAVPVVARQLAGRSRTNTAAVS